MDVAHQFIVVVDADVLAQHPSGKHLHEFGSLIAVETGDQSGCNGLAKMGDGTWIPVRKVYLDHATQSIADLREYMRRIVPPLPGLDGEPLESDESSTDPKQHGMWCSKYQRRRTRRRASRNQW